MYGIEVVYIPRKIVNRDEILAEVQSSKFDNAYIIEAYLNTYEGHTGGGDILSKFGMQLKDEINLVISRERYEEYIGAFIQDEDPYEIEVALRPREGDIIYFPLSERFFEVKFVEHEKPFYQLQKNYVYTLKCELFRYEDEVIDTGVDDIDDTLEGTIGSDGEETFIGRTQTLTLIGSGTTSTATATLVNGGIRLITVTNRGGGYTSVPTVGLSSAPLGGVTGIASAVMIGGVVACNDNVNPAARSVQAVDIVNAGSGYTVAPGVRFIGGGGAGAAATATIGNGIVGIVSITSNGSGYSTAPTIRFTNEIFATGVATVSAAATAVVSAAGTITSIRITNAGLGYSVAPTITISSPFSSGIGTFQFNEVITGQTSGTTARVRKWSAVTNQLEISNISGSFVSGETVVGAASSASYQIRSVETNMNNDGYSDNDEIEIEAEQIIDFSEFNPFGIP